MKKLVPIILAIFAFLLATAFTVLHEETPAAIDALKWILYAGGFAAIVSWVCERWPVYQTWTSTAKSAFQYGAAIFLSFGSYALLTYMPASVWVAIDPWIRLALGVAGTYGIGQIAHTADPQRIKNAADVVAATPAPVEVIKT